MSIVLEASDPSQNHLKGLFLLRGDLLSPRSASLSAEADLGLAPPAASSSVLSRQAHTTRLSCAHSKFSSCSCVTGTLGVRDVLKTCCGSLSRAAFWQRVSLSFLTPRSGWRDHLSWAGICVGCFLLGHPGAQVGRHGHGPTWVRQTNTVSVQRPFPEVQGLGVCLSVCVSLWMSLSVVWAERSL